MCVYIKGCMRKTQKGEVKTVKGQQSTKGCENEQELIQECFFFGRARARACEGMHGKPGHLFGEAIIIIGKKEEQSKWMVKNISCDVNQT